jgi:hypothetical protein
MRRSAFVDHKERFRDKARNSVYDDFASSYRGSDSFGGFKRKCARKDREVAEQPLFVRSQELIAPVKRGA